MAGHPLPPTTVPLDLHTHTHSEGDPYSGTLRVTQSRAVAAAAYSVGSASAGSEWHLLGVRMCSIVMHCRECVGACGHACNVGQRVWPAAWLPLTPNQTATVCNQQPQPAVQQPVSCLRMGHSLRRRALLLAACAAVQSRLQHSTRWQQRPRHDMVFAISAPCMPRHALAQTRSAPAAAATCCMQNAPPLWK